jgi:predicted NAD/FAD-binding protein
MKIAIIGTGIAGLGAAYLLQRAHEIELFEANEYVGGHTNTITAVYANQAYTVDTGFIVYNTDTYPLLIRLFDELGVATQPSNMTFSTSHRGSGFEIASHGYRGLLARKRNLIIPAFWQVIRGHMRFGREGMADMHNPRYADYTLGQYMAEKRLPTGFVKYILLPIASAVWSSPQTAIYDFPLSYLLHFYHNHGVLDGRDVQWRTVVGGSAEYVKKLTRPFAHRIHLNTPIRTVCRHDDHVTLTLPDGIQKQFDQVVIATHSDQALRLLGDPSPEEQAILGAIPYQANTAVLHTDERQLPRHRDAWASWNYTIAPDHNEGDPATLTYWMNSLQNLTAPVNFCVTINPTEPIASDKVIKTIAYDHPLYSLASMAAQQRLDEINGRRRTYFCGAYFGYGFHEDGLRSGVAVAEKLGIKWEA